MIITLSMHWRQLVNNAAMMGIELAVPGALSLRLPPPVRNHQGAGGRSRSMIAFYQEH
jgi:hypothetical protein